MNDYKDVNQLQDAACDAMKEFKGDRDCQCGYILSLIGEPKQDSDWFGQVGLEKRETLKLLVGPNGYTVWKMLLARCEEVV